jgi:2-succinyl-5-enolpyruvyl-6-hydroxy-3-cyclohexene-1-carboxylate synthase
MKTKLFIFSFLAFALLFVSCGNRQQEQASEVVETQSNVSEWINRIEQRSEYLRTTENRSTQQPTQAPISVTHLQLSETQDTIFVTHSQPIRGYRVSTK